MKKATRQQTRTHNKQLVLRTIYQVGEISRADIARATHLTRTTVSHIVAELIKDSLVAETGRGPSEGGKPPVLLTIPSDARFVIGIDLADSEFRGGVIDMYGRFLQRVSVPVGSLNGTEALDLVYDVIGELLGKAGGPILGIGVGTPGLVDARRGMVTKAVNLDWQNLALGDLIETRFGLPVYVGNDSQLAAQGEFMFGRSQGLQNLIVVKVGRGIGAGIVLNGRLYYGDGSAAGEIGHVQAAENGIRCLCGHYGCLETVASTRAIVMQAQAFARKNPTAAINTLVASPDDITMDVVLQAIQSGDDELDHLVTGAGYYLGIAIAHLIGAFNIEQIIIAGSMARVGQPLLDAINRTIVPRSLSQLVSQTHVELSDLGQDIVILGSASLVLSNELGVV